MVGLKKKPLPDDASLAAIHDDYRVVVGPKKRRLPEDAFLAAI